MNKLKSSILVLLLINMLFCPPLSKVSAISAYLNLTSSPTGAVVYINNRSTSYVTPCTITGLTSGYTYGLHLEKSGYAPLDVPFIAGSLTSLLLTLAPAVSDSFMNFETFPTGASVYLKDVTGISPPTLIGIAPCTLGNLTPRVSYTIIFEKVGYVTETVSLKAVAGGSTQTMTLRIPSVPPSLRLTSLPTGATVYVNGVKQASLTPCTIENLIIARVYTIRVEKTGYTPHEEGIMPKDGVNFLSVELIPLEKTTFDIALDSTPSGALVSLDGVFISHSPYIVGTSPCTFKNAVPGARHTFTFSKKGHISQTVQITAKAADANISVTLKKELVLNITSSPAGATVYINDVKQPKLTPCKITGYGYGAVLNFAIKKEGYQPFYQTFTTWDEGTYNVKAKLLIIPGIYLTSFPSGAAVYLDGAQYHSYTTPCTITNFAVNTIHNIRLEKTGYAPITKTVKMPSSHLPVFIKLLVIRQSVVNIKSYPSGAFVFINKMPSGLTPEKMFIAPLQTIIIVVQKAGYLTQTKTIYLENGKNYTWVANLKHSP